MATQKTFTEVTAPKSRMSTNSIIPANMSGGFTPSLFYQKTFTEVTAPKSIVYTSFTTGAYSIFTGHALFVQKTFTEVTHFTRRKEVTPANMPCDYRLVDFVNLPISSHDQCDEIGNFLGL